jgi:SAM-dependent methyltransferase
VDAAEYDIHTAVEDRHWWWRARREILAEVIARFLPPAPHGGMRIADVGCGSGGNLRMLSRFGDVLGAERDPRAIEFLREKLGREFRVVQHSIPEALPGPFDLLAMFDVLEHVQDDRRAMRWAAEHLAPGGILVITVPAFQFLWTEQDDAVHHYRRYSPDRLAQIVPDSLELLHLTCFNSLLFAPIAATRTVMNLIPRGTRAPRSHLGIPPRPINELFYRLFRLERHFVPRVRLPLGVSVLLVARRTSSRE